MHLHGVAQVAAMLLGKLAVDQGVILLRIDGLAQGRPAVGGGDDLVQQFALGKIQRRRIEAGQGHVFEVIPVLAKFDGGHLAVAEVGYAPGAQNPGKLVRVLLGLLDDRLYEG